MQNRVFAGDILEGIFIYIFHFTFKIDKDENFSKYIYNNLYRFKNDNNMFKDWFLKDKFNPNELNNINELLNNDIEIKDSIVNENDITNTIYFLLINIYKEKYLNFKKEHNKGLFFVNKNSFDKYKIVKLILSDIRENDSKEGKYRYIPTMKIFKSFLISVFIYYQNNNNNLIKCMLDDENIKKQYNIGEARVNANYSNILLAPIRIEPEINKIVLTENIFNELGLFEIGKLLLFNKNIKIINSKRIIILSKN
jgi:hypothetical protein